MKKITINLFALLFIITNNYAGNVYYVREQPSVGEYATLTEALSECSDPVDINLRDTIDVLGTFTGTHIINKSVVIRGHGWDETILQGSNNVPDASSDKTGQVITITAGSSDAGSNVDIYNLTVRYGKNTDSGQRGAGIYVYSNKTGKTILQDLYVHHNYSNQAGGIGLVATNVDVISCNITDNISTNAGGGLGIFSSNLTPIIDANVNVHGCTVSKNINLGTIGGGVCIDGAPKYSKLDILIANSTIVNNTSKTLGGGISLKGGGANATETNVTFRLNYSTIAYNNVSEPADITRHVGFGGADVPTGYPKVYILNSIIAQNTVDVTPQKNEINFAKIQPIEVKNSLFGKTYGLPEFAVNTQVDISASNLKLDTLLRIKETKVPVLPLLSGSIAIDYISENQNIEFDQRGWTREPLKSDVGSYEFKKVSALEINAPKTTLSVSQTTQISVSPTPVDIDSTNYIYEVTGTAVSVSSTGVVTALEEGSSTLVVKSVDNPDVSSNEISFTVSFTSSDNAQKMDDPVLINPITDRLVLINGCETDKVALYGISGKIIYSSNYFNSGIPMNNIEGGVYYLQIKRSNNEVLNFKVIKQ